MGGVLLHVAARAGSGTFEWVDGSLLLTKILESPSFSGAAGRVQISDSEAETRGSTSSSDKGMSSAVVAVACCGFVILVLVGLLLYRRNKPSPGVFQSSPHQGTQHGMCSAGGQTDLRHFYEQPRACMADSHADSLYIAPIPSHQRTGMHKAPHLQEDPSDVDADEQPAYSALTEPAEYDGNPENHYQPFEDTYDTPCTVHGPAEYSALTDHVMYDAKSQVQSVYDNTDVLNAPLDNPYQPVYRAHAPIDGTGDNDSSHACTNGAQSSLKLDDSAPQESFGFLTDI